MTGSLVEIPPRDALLVLVGVTAGRAKRQQLRAALEKRGGFTVYLPWLPFRLGIRACSWIMSRFVRSRILPRGHRTVHVLNYIGGGYAFRLAGPGLNAFPLGRVLYIRSPLQELVPRRAVERWSRPGVWLAMGKAVADMAKDEIMRLPVPEAGTERGLIVEMLPSAAARSLGLDHHSVPGSAWAYEALLPGATDAIRLQVSHDHVYSDPEVLDQVHAFISTGEFRRTGAANA